MDIKLILFLVGMYVIASFARQKAVNQNETANYFVKTSYTPNKPVSAPVYDVVQPYETSAKSSFSWDWIDNIIKGGENGVIPEEYYSGALESGTTPPRGLAETFRRAEEKYRLPKGLLVKVAWKESRFKADAYNKGSTASGIMQIVPRWHPDRSYPDKLNVWNPESAIPYAGWYLRWLRDRTNSWEEALAAYNWGIGNLWKYGMGRIPAETRDYVASIGGDVIALGPTGGTWA